MARHFRGRGIVLRFIEYMDVGATNGWRMDQVVPSSQVLGATAGALAARTSIVERTRRDGRSAGVIATAVARSASSPASPRRSVAIATRAAVHGGQVVHMPIRQPVVTICARCCAAVATIWRSRRCWVNSGASAATAIRNCVVHRAPRRPAASAASKCTTSVGERGRRSALRADLRLANQLGLQAQLWVRGGIAPRGPTGDFQRGTPCSPARPRAHCPDRRRARAPSANARHAAMPMRPAAAKARCSSPVSCQQCASRVVSSCGSRS